MASNNTTNVNTGGGSINLTGGAIGSNNQVAISGDISTQVTQTINSLPNSSDNEIKGIKELLVDLQALVTESTDLSQEQKEDLLIQVEAFAEATQVSKEEKKKGIVRRAKTTFEGVLKALPTTAQIVNACGNLLPLILKHLNYPG